MRKYMALRSSPQSSEGDAESAAEKAQRIQGWLTAGEGEFLFSLAKRCSGSGVIVEIGSWKGRSTVYLGAGSKEGSGVPVYAVDHHTGSSEHRETTNGGIWTFDEFMENMRNAGLDGTVIPVVRESEDAARGWDKPVELLFIDGAHEYELVKRDIISWSAHLAEGGTLAVHDSTASLAPLVAGFAGPKRAVNEVIFSSGNFKAAGIAGRITYAVKCGRPSRSDRLGMRGVLAKKLICDSVDYLLWKTPGFIPLGREGL
jgi:MMP 1-O-methyltransferase